MNMIGHQAVGVYVTTEFHRMSLQLVEVVEAVFISEVACGAVIPALNYVPGNAGYRESSPSWHGEILFGRVCVVKCYGRG